MVNLIVWDPVTKFLKFLDDKRIKYTHFEYEGDEGIKVEDYKMNSYTGLIGFACKFKSNGNWIMI